MDKDKYKKKTAEEEEAAEAELTFTQQEVDAKISEAAAKAEETIKARLEKQYQKDLQKAAEEAERKAKLSEEERRNEEFEEERRALEQERRELEQDKLKTKLTAELTKRNLPIALLESLVALEDETKAMQKVEDLEQEYKKAIDEAVKQKYSKGPPAAGNDRAELPEVNEFAAAKNKKQADVKELPNPWARS